MQLGLLVAAYMKVNKVSTRELAQIIGIDHCTLYRFSRGRNIRLSALAKVVAWAWGPANVKQCRLESALANP